MESDPRNVNKKGTRKRHKHETPEEWKRQVIKNKRLKGESYKNVKGQEIQAKVMGPACTSTFCKKSSLRHCPSLSEKQRKDIFDQGRQSILKSEGDRLENEQVRGYVSLTIKFVIQRLRNEFKVEGQNIRALKVRPM